MSRLYDIQWDFVCLCLEQVSRLMTKPTKWHVRPAKTQIWADAQADLSLRWAHMPFCWFCHEAAQVHMSVKNSSSIEKLHMFYWNFIFVSFRKTISGKVAALFFYSAVLWWDRRSMAKMMVAVFVLWPKTIQLLIIDQIYPNQEPHNFPLVHLNLYTKINCCCYTHTDVSSAKIFCMDFTAENKNIYNLHGWQLGVTNKTRSQFAAYNDDKIINWWKIGLIILRASPG